MKHLSFLIIILAMHSCGARGNYYNYSLSTDYKGEAPMLNIHTTFSGKGGESNRFSPDPLVGYRWDTISVGDKLELYELTPIMATTDNHASFENLESLETNTHNVTILGNGNIMVDFGIESAGWLEIDSPDLSGDIELSISEYNEPAILNAGAENPVKTARPIRYGNTYRLELNKELHEGVRFGWIHVRNFNKPFTITAVRKVAQVKPANYEGSFISSSNILNRIWYTGAYTVRLNMLYDYISPILMERSDRYSWAGDAHLIQAAAMVAFGNYESIRQNLDHNKDKSQGIESYELYWIKSAIDYYMHSGDAVLFDGQLSVINNKLNHAINVFDNCAADGSSISKGYMGWDERLGAGFENSACQWNIRHYRFMVIETLIESARAVALLGKKELSQKYEAKAHELFAKVSTDPTFLDNIDIHIASTAINTGLISQPQIDKLFENLFLNRSSRVSFSPFNQQGILIALASMGQYQKVLETIDDCWGSEIRYGGTTFFEVFNPSWADALPSNGAVPNVQCGYTSLCHPWSSGVTRFLSDEILGIKPLTAGYSHTLIKPNPDYISSIKGSVPTPHGVIKADFNFDKGEAEINIPEAITATLAIPKYKAEILHIMRDGKSIDFKTDKTHAYIKDVKGDNIYKIVYGNPLSENSPSAPLFYPIKKGVEGDQVSEALHKDGVILFGKDRDFRDLPSYIKSAEVCANNQSFKWKPERGNIGKSLNYKGEQKELGYISTSNPSACNQTFTIDIKTDTSYLLTLYFVDEQSAEPKRIGCELYDLKTKEVISPLSVVDNYQNSKTLSYKVDRDVRVRIYHIRGTQATLSGLFFSRTNIHK